MELNSLSLVHRMKRSALGLVVVFSLCFDIIFEFSHVRQNEEKKSNVSRFCPLHFFEPPPFFYLGAW